MNSDDAKDMASRANRPIFPNDDQVKVDYTVMNATQIRHACGDQAHTWATAFMTCIARRQLETGQPVIDHDVMQHWFANAIEAACVKCEQKYREEIERKERERCDALRR